jgi:crotonobetainyl-CoA:carnitine CoA-transferase CaiB-like acyl-CoA transferase
MSTCWRAPSSCGIPTTPSPIRARRFSSTINPRLVMVRMPAFGLSGPWRDAVGFAQTMEQLTGLAWLTGHRDDQPCIQRGPCDPLAGMHAAFAVMMALARREATGTGCHIKMAMMPRANNCTPEKMAMVEAALNAAAEPVIELTAYGALLGRDGNRSPGAAPQGLYACRGAEQWLALSIATDAQWQELVALLGRPAWAADPGLATMSGRRAAHDRIDAQLRAWAAEQELAPTVESLVGAGVPAATVFDPRATSRHPQMAARGFFESTDHPAIGTHPIPTLPFHYASVAGWIRTPPPRLGEHNHAVLRDLLGLDDVAIERLAAEDIIGERPRGS